MIGREGESVLLSHGQVKKARVALYHEAREMGGGGGAPVSLVCIVEQQNMGEGDISFTVSRGERREAPISLPHQNHTNEIIRNVIDIY